MKKRTGLATQHLCNHIRRQFQDFFFIDGRDRWGNIYIPFVGAGCGNLDVLQRIDRHPASQVDLLIPRLWKQNFADNPDVVTFIIVAGILAALAGDEMTIIVCKCESGNAKMPVITMDPVVIRDRFMKAVQK